MLYYSITNEENKMELIIMAFIFIVVFTGFWRWMDPRE